MKSLDTLIRLARFRADALQQQLVELAGAQAALEARIEAHVENVQGEQRTALTHPDTLFVYGGFAQAAMETRAAMEAERAALAAQEAELRALLAEAFIELKKIETLSEQEAAKLLAAEGRRDQALMDDAAASMLRRRA